MNPWFRFYAEALNDPKVQGLDGETFKTWVNLLCLSCNGNGTLPETFHISFHLRMSLEATEKALTRLVQGNLLDEIKNQHQTTYKIHSWEKRQYKSSTSTERVKRFRNKKRNVTETLQKRPQIQITDTEQNIEAKASNVPPKRILKSYSTEFEEFWKEYPKNSGPKSEAYKSFLKIPKETSYGAIIESVRKYSAYLARTATPTAHATTWLNQQRWEVDYESLTAEPPRAIAKPSQLDIIKGAVRAAAGQG